MEIHSSIHGAKLAIMAEVPFVLKTAAEGVPYTFASEREFLKKCRPAMLKHGVHCRPIATSLLHRDRVNGQETIIMKVTYQFRHYPSKTFENVSILSEAASDADKAVPMAMTLAFKYALRQWLTIETGDDPDAVPPPTTNLYERAKRALEQTETLERLQEVLDRARKLEYRFTKQQFMHLEAIHRDRRWKLEEEVSRK